MNYQLVQAPLQTWPLGQIARNAHLLAGLIGKPLCELLPEGEYPWERHEREEECGGYAYKGTPVKLPERYQFLEKLSPDQVVDGVRTNAKRTYRAFLVGNYVLVECDASCNALYVFKRGTNWLQDVQRSKAEILRQKPESFVDRVVHKGEWQSRVLKLVA